MRKHRGQKGLTLIEVLVSLMILTGGSVYVLQALAQSARVQKLVEDRNQFYPFLASQIAKLEMRVSPEKDSFRKTAGTYLVEKNRYEWNMTGTFHNPLEAKAPRESLGTSVLVDRLISVQLPEQKNSEKIKVWTLTKAVIPENKK